MMCERIIGTAKSYATGKPDSIVVVIPKQVNPKKGVHYIVRQDNKGRLIYEPIQ